MAYGTDISVFVEDKKGDVGAPGSSPWWLSPDIDIPAHSGTAFQGSNDVKIRVHSHEEPIIEEKIVAEVYVGQPGFVLSPTVGTKRIDPGNLLFRPPNVPGPEPAADELGATLSFPWTPTNSPSDVDGTGHRCLIVRAFPQSVTPPTDPFDVANESHEAQHNIEVLATTMDRAPMKGGGWGTPWDPRKREADTGLWWERFATMAAKNAGRHFVAWAFDPDPSREITGLVRGALKEAGVGGFSDEPPGDVSLEPIDTRGEAIDPDKLLGGVFAETSGVGSGLFARDRLLAALALELEPQRLAGVLMRFDLTTLKEGTAAVLHGAQWNESGEPEGGMTVVALAPTAEDKKPAADSAPGSGY